jgi:hypothetical protein
MLLVWSAGADVVTVVRSVRASHCELADESEDEAKIE